MTALFDELRRNGLVEGRNLVVEGSGIGIPYPRFADAARELAKGKIEALVVGGGNSPIRSVQTVAAAIPIIGVADDMVEAGVAWSLVQPRQRHGSQYLRPGTRRQKAGTADRAVAWRAPHGGVGRPEGTATTATAGTSGRRARPRCRAFDPSGNQR